MHAMCTHIQFAWICGSAKSHRCWRTSRFSNIYRYWNVSFRQKNQWKSKKNRWELKITEQNAVNTNMYRPANTKREENAATKVITTEVLFVWLRKATIKENSFYEFVFCCIQNWNRKNPHPHAHCKCTWISFVCIDFESAFICYQNAAKMSIHRKLLGIDSSGTNFFPQFTPLHFRYKSHIPPYTWRRCGGFFIQSNLIEYGNRGCRYYETFIWECLWL